MTQTIEKTAFAPRVRAFLEDLAANNNREWFRAEKPRYDAEVRRPAEMLVDRIALRLSQRTRQRVRPKLFRLHRDVRFSNDKTPFFTHLHAAWTLPDGRGWYFGLSPNYATAAAGVMVFDEAQTQDWRAALDSPEGGKLAALLPELKGRMDPPPLVSPPAPYDSAHPHAELLRHTGCLVWIDDLYHSLCVDAEAALVDTFDRLAPLQDWLARNVAR
ncbi:TIGR02453 family protein [Citreicella sp. C3M06]|uniref:TIGR02453 family protein n=1 Tax=Citreicella sp. C3M06 TaxID=2841564 RepID=UPI001C082EF5|nr:TIGR02453 family protein [Citreicella sp. C3M06]MBU2963171.1 TIGR02453 family protein [Citreicella sp. C3M06]